MIVEVIVLFCLFAALGIVLAKLLNLFKLSALYPREWIFLTQAGMFLVWGLYYSSFFMMVGSETTITDGADTFVVKSNDYLFLEGFAPFVDIALYVSIFISVSELVLYVITLAPSVRGRMKLT